VLPLSHGRPSFVRRHEEELYLGDNAPKLNQVVPFALIELSRFCRNAQPNAWLRKLKLRRSRVSEADKAATSLTLIVACILSHATHLSL
jgi:hypothetical protein